MDEGGLGATYQDGEIIVRQGDVGDRMFIIQKGRAQVLIEKDGQETPIRVAEEGELIGEMAIFEKVARSATVRALGKARVLTVDKKNFLRRIHEDPALAFRVVQTMSRRIRELSDELARIKGESPQA